MISEIFTADCVQRMETLEDSSVRLVIADPPYNIGFDYQGEFDDSLPKDVYLRWSRSWMTQALRLLTEDGSFWLIISDEYVAELKIIAEEIGFEIRSWNIWFYTFGVQCSGKYSRSHTHMLWFGKAGKKPLFNRQDILVPSARQLVYNDKRAAAGGKTPDNTWIYRPEEFPIFPEGLDCNEGDMDTVCESRIAGTFKRRIPGAPNQMPELIIGRMVKAHSNPGDVVLDPFAGTGTTPAVAKKLGRIGVGIEQSVRLAGVSKDRLDLAQNGDPLT